MSEARAEEFTNNGDRGQFLEFIEEYRRADEKVAESVGDRRELRKRIKEAGIDMPAFDRARKLNGLSDELRERRRQAENQYMVWLGKPLGYQGQMFEDGEDEEQPPAPSPSQIEICEEQGRAAAMNGHARESNPWPPETLLHAAWDRAWLEIAHPAEALQDEVTEALGAENEVLLQRERRAAQRKAQRPPAAPAAAEETERRPPGRPKGATDRKPRKRRGAGNYQAAE